MHCLDFHMKNAVDNVTEGISWSVNGEVNVFLLGCECTSVLLSCFLDALSCAVCKWSHYKLKRGCWPFPQRVTIQRRRTNTFKKCQHTALLFETDSSQCQSVPQSRFTHAASVLQKQLHVPWWFIMSNTFWHLVLHTFFSRWNLTKSYIMLEVKLKNGYSSAIFFVRSTPPPIPRSPLYWFPLRTVFGLSRSLD